MDGNVNNQNFWRPVDRPNDKFIQWGWECRSSPRSASDDQCCGCPEASSCLNDRPGSSKDGLKNLNKSYGFRSYLKNFCEKKWSVLVNYAKGKYIKLNDSQKAKWRRKQKNKCGAIVKRTEKICRKNVKNFNATHWDRLWTNVQNFDAELSCLEKINKTRKTFGENMENFGKVLNWRNERGQAPFMEIVEDDFSGEIAKSLNEENSTGYLERNWKRHPENVENFNKEQTRSVLDAREWERLWTKIKNIDNELSHLEEMGSGENVRNFDRVSIGQVPLMENVDDDYCGEILKPLDGENSTGYFESNWKRYPVNVENFNDEQTRSVFDSRDWERLWTKIKNIDNELSHFEKMEKKHKVFRNSMENFEKMMENVEDESSGEVSKSLDEESYSMNMENYVNENVENLLYEGNQLASDERTQKQLERYVESVNDEQYHFVSHEAKWKRRPVMARNFLYKQDEASCHETGQNRIEANQLAFHGSTQTQFGVNIENSNYEQIETNDANYELYRTMEEIFDNISSKEESNSTSEENSASNLEKFHQVFGESVNFPYDQKQSELFEVKLERYSVNLKNIENGAFKRVSHVSFKAKENLGAFHNFFKLFRQKYPYLSRSSALARAKCRYCYLTDAEKNNYRNLPSLY